MHNFNHRMIFRSVVNLITELVIQQLVNSYSVNMLISFHPKSFIIKLACTVFFQRFLWPGCMAWEF